MRRTAENKPGTKKRLLTGAAGSFLMVAAGGCSINLGGERQEPGSTHKDSQQPVIFDARGGGSNYIQVYPGVSGRPEDTVSNGGHFAGEALLAKCITEGRTVKADTTVGETPGSSNQWVLLAGRPEHYATALYLDEQSLAAAALKRC